MGRAPCCEKAGLKKGPWTPEEDKILVDYIQANGHGSWRSLPKLAGLSRCGKSCRLRWTNYLRPDIKRGPFTTDEQKSIVQLHGIVGNKWSTIAAQLPGRTDNEIKNYWNTHLKKRLLRMGLDPDTCAPSSPSAAASFPAARHMAQWESARLEAEARLSRDSLLSSSVPPVPAAAAAVASSCSAGTTTSVAAQGKGELEPADKPKPAPDFFLRIWNSEVGDAFRKPVSGGPSESSPGSWTTKLASAKAEPLVADEAATRGGDDSSGGSNVVEETSEEATYQMYLDFAGEELGLFHHAHLGGFSLFPSDLAADASLDTAFK